MGQRHREEKFAHSSVHFTSDTELITEYFSLSKTCVETDWQMRSCDVLHNIHVQILETKLKKKH